MRLLDDAEAAMIFAVFFRLLRSRAIEARYLTAKIMAKKRQELRATVKVGLKWG